MTGCIGSKPLADLLPNVLVDERALADGRFNLIVAYAEQPADDIIGAIDRLLKSWLEVCRRWGFTSHPNPSVPPSAHALDAVPQANSVFWEILVERVDPVSIQVLRNCLVGHSLDVAEMTSIRIVSLRGGEQELLAVPVAPVSVVALPEYLASLNFAVEWEDPSDSRNMRRFLTRFRDNLTEEVIVQWSEAMAFWAELAQNGYPLDAEAFVHGTCAIEGIQVAVHDVRSLETVIDRFEGQEEAWEAVLNMSQWLAYHFLPVQSVLIE